MKQLPSSPNLFHLKKQAKELLHAYQQKDASAIERFTASLPAARSIARELRLHDAQSCIAREYGFASWTELKHYVEWKSAEREEHAPLVKRWLGLVYGEGYDSPRPRLAMRILREMPDIIADDPYIACAVGDEARIRRTLEEDAAWANMQGGPLKMPPLVAVTHSGFVREVNFAEPLMRCAKLLLEHGADPDQAWISPDFPDSPLSALYGAAGKNHHAGMTQLLLEAGANPNDNESLYHSAESSDLTCTRLLLAAGAVVDGTNALNRVLDYDRIEGLRLLLEHGGDPGKPATGISPTGALVLPLFHAIRRGRSLAHIQLLLDAGANRHAVDHEGMTVYRFALLHGRADVAALLDDAEPLSAEEQFIAACASADRAEAMRIVAADSGIIARLSEKQLRLLPAMAAQQNMPAVKTMVEAGWPIDTLGGDWKASSLNLSVYRGDAAMAEYLLTHGADWTVKHGFNNNVVGTLSFASRGDNMETESGDWLGCAKALLAHGVPLPPPEYEFSEEIEEYFDEQRNR